MGRRGDETRQAAATSTSRPSAPGSRRSRGRARTGGRSCGPTRRAARRRPTSVIDAVADRMRAGASNTHGAFAAQPRHRRADRRRARARAPTCSAATPTRSCSDRTRRRCCCTSSRSFGAHARVPATRSSSRASTTTRTSVRGSSPRATPARPCGGSTSATTTSRSTSASLAGAIYAIGPSSSRSRSHPTPSGSMPPVAEVVRLAKAVGALVAIDAVHLAQHRASTCARWGADIVATSPYKFFGPHQGMVGVRRELLASWEPYKLDAAEDVDPHRWESGHASPRGDGGNDRGDRATSPRAPGPARWVVDAVRRFHAHERALATRFLEGVGHDPRRAADRDRRPCVAWTSERRRSRSGSGEQHPLETARGARRARHLHVGRPLLRDRGVRAARAARLPAARSGSGSATTTRSTRSIACSGAGGAAPNLGVPSGAGRYA